MKSEPDTSEEAAELRRRAKARLMKSKQEKPFAPLNEVDYQRVLQELEIHQIELEMQNDELKRLIVEAETARNESARLYDFAPAGYFTLSRDGRIRQANLTGASLFGMERENLLKRPFSLLVHTNSYPMFNDFLEKVFESRENQTSEIVLKRQDKILWARMEAISEKGDECRLVLMDITDRKKMEEKLNRTMDELKRSNADLEQFAYVASHDLQEPLRMISSYIELLARRYKGKLDQDADEFIDFALDGAGRLRQLINDLLEYSRLGSRGKPLTLTSSENALVQALNNLQLVIQDNKAEVIHDKLPDVFADEIQLVQLFQNLVGNAIKFHKNQAPRVHISATEHDKEWLFSVQDNGIGIDPKNTERIFLIFQRLHERSKYEGSGIGLSMCKKIVLRHGGQIWVESQLGQGATFFFTLPKKETIPADILDKKTGSTA